MTEYSALELLKKLRSDSLINVGNDLFENLKYDEFIPSDSKYPTDRNFERRAEITELIGENLKERDLEILRKLADFEIEYTKKLNYHNCLAEIVFYLYELGHKEDVIYAYEVRFGVNNMDASVASYDETLSMRTPKDEMMEYLDLKVKNDSSFLVKYPDIIENTEYAYEFEYLETEEKFNEELLGYYYGQDTVRIKKFYARK